MSPPSRHMKQKSLNDGIFVVMGVIYTHLEQEDVHSHLVEHFEKQVTLLR